MSGGGGGGGGGQGGVIQLEITAVDSSLTNFVYDKKE